MKAYKVLLFHRRRLLALAVLFLAAGGIAAAATLGERFWERPAKAAAPPTAQAVDPVETGSVDEADAVGRLIQKLADGGAGSKGH
jgi:hypothetical protein